MNPRDVPAGRRGGRRPASFAVQVPVEEGPDPVPGRLVGVGIGPGAPDLLTLRAVRALRRAHRVLVPTTSAEWASRSEAVIADAVPDVRTTRLVVSMGGDARARAGALRASCRMVAAWLDAGDEVAVAILGDPSVYSSFTLLAAGVRGLRPGTPVVTVPGILAGQELAARTGSVLADEQQAMIVLPVNRDLDAFAAEVADPTRTVVAYKVGARLGEVAARVRAAGRSGAVFGEVLGFDGERLEPLDEAGTEASYLSCVLVPASEGGSPSPWDDGQATEPEAPEAPAAAVAVAPRAPGPGLGPAGTPAEGPDGWSVTDPAGGVEGSGP